MPINRRRKWVLIAAMLLIANAAHAEPQWNKLADAIRVAEGNPNYGVLTKYKHTTPRQACINTCKHKWRDWVAVGGKGDYIAYLGSKYAPTDGATNDPTGLNRNWVSNVRAIYGT